MPRPKTTKTKKARSQRAYRADVAPDVTVKASRQAANQPRKKMGGRSKASGNNDRNAAIVKAYYTDGISGTVIAKKLGLSISQTYRVINAVKGKMKRAEKTAITKAVKKAAVKRKAAAKKSTAKSAVAKKATTARFAVKKSIAKKIAAKRAPAKKKAAKKRARR